MLITRRASLGLVAATVPLLIVRPAFAAGTTIKVSLWDKGANSLDMMASVEPMGMGMPGMAMMGEKATMGITATPDTVPAGDVTFEVSNDSKDIIHEMIVSPVVDETKPLPYDMDLMKVNEDAAGHLGEVAELDPGKAGGLTLPMTAGKYILFCNIPGHYAMGMWTIFTVTG
jgi:uncharacterized cupredoxin-like copper-binding protein